MIRTSVVAGVMLVSATLAGCTKDGGSGSALSAGQMSLLGDLPKGGTLLFGGNYIRLTRDVAASPLGKLVVGVTGSVPGMAAWQSCFMSLKALDMLGNARIVGTTVELAYAMTGITVDQVADCAKQAAYPAVIDPDRKYISIDAASQFGPMKIAYLVLPDGAVFSRTVLNVLAPKEINASDRPMLEVALKDGTAKDDTALVALASKVNKDEVWFVGDATGTPVANKIDDAWGTIDFASGLALDVSVELKDGTLAGKIEDGLKQAKQQAGALGAELKGVVDKIDLDRSGNRVRFKLALDNQQLQMLVDKLGPMMALGKH